MELLQGLLVVLLFIKHSAGVSPDHKIVLKTLQQAEFECKQYLRVPSSEEAPCEPRCEEILLRSWTDCTGLGSIPYGRHFQPDPTDGDFINRTQYCLDTALNGVPAHDVCCHSRIAYQCYRDQYGNPVRVPQIAPMSKILVRSTIEDCARLLQIDDLEMMIYGLTHFDLSAKSRSLLRCIVIRQGLYSDETGPDLDRMFVQCGGYEIEEHVFRENAQACIDDLRSQCLDNATLATRITNYCFPPGVGPGTIPLIETLLPTVGSLVGGVLGTVRGLKLLDSLLKPLAPLLIGLPYALNPALQKNLLDLVDNPPALAAAIAALEKGPLDPLISFLAKIEFE